MKLLVSVLLIWALAAMAWGGCGKKPENPPPAPAHAAPPGAAGDAAIRLTAAPDQEFIRIGPHSLSRKHLDLKAALIRAKYKDTDEIEAKAAAQLVQGLLYCLVLESMGKPVTWKMLEDEVARIDRQTQAPEQLSQMKKLFENAADGGGASWMTNYALFFVLLPDFANRKFHFDVFPREGGIQAKRLEAARAALATLSSQEKPDFAALAKENGWTRDEVLFDRYDGFRRKEMPGDPPVPGPRDEKMLPQANGRWADLDDQLMSKTEMNRVVGQVVELDSAFLIMRWTGFENEARRTRIVERLLIHKIQAGQYYEEKVRNTSVVFANKELRDKFKKLISWSALLRLE